MDVELFEGFTICVGTEAVEVLHLLVKEYCLKVHIDGKAFAQMKNLRILKICDEELRHRWHAFDLKLWKESKVNYNGKLKFLSNKLRLLYWHGFPFKCFPSDFYPENIVAIDLSYSHIKNLWTSPKVMMTLRYRRDEFQSHSRAPDSNTRRRCHPNDEESSIFQLVV
ncbi:hypothetical protein Ccrd_024273, partial [Cynara cardunculus var. scolymus]